ncbi:hypothetical protein [Arthrobacter methylotrophus]
MIVMSIRMHGLGKARFTFVLAGLLCLGLGACSAPSPASSSGAGSGADKTAGKSTGAAQTRDQWDFAYRSCLAKKGFDLPKDGKPDFGDRQSEYLKAGDACAGEVGPLPGSDGPKMSDEQMLELALQMTKCLREKGYTLQDPKLGDAVGSNTPYEVDRKDESTCGEAAAKKGEEIAAKNKEAAKK